MHIYFLLIRLAALLGHKKAKLLVKGQADSLRVLRDLSLPQSPNVVWVHAASVGEFEQARPIIEMLRVRHPEYRIVLTFFSPSGYELRKNYDKVDMVLYLPFATRRNARLFLDAVRPDIAVFVKYEFWPAYLRELARRGIQTYSISAIFRPNQLFFKWFGKPYLRLLRCFTHIYVQDQTSLGLLAAHGIDRASIAGDTRFDRVVDVMAASKQIPMVERFTRQARVLVAGSTWPQDEKLLRQYVLNRPDVKLVLVPHEIHPEHLQFIFNLWQGQLVRYTEANEMSVLHTRTMLVDTIGYLSSIYRYGQVAYVGGGFGVGIHNTLEAAVYGMPVLFGPNYSNFREAKGLIEAGAACSVRDYAELESALDQAFEQQEMMGVSARAYVESERGATEFIYTQLFDSHIQ